MKLTVLVPWLCPNSLSRLIALRIKGGGDKPLTCEIEHLPVVVGRGEEADIRLADRWVSKVHCRLTAVDGDLVLRDLESRNGTAVNRELVTERQLRMGDIISIGMSEIEVVHIADRKRLMQADT
jgi:predicted component of type VI protein secretion system